jgi:predicted dehydrogenase
LTIAIIGTGWGARIQVPAFRAAGLDVSVLAGSSAEKTSRIAGELGVPNAVSDWRDVLNRADIRVVSIVTPPHLHAEMAIAALEAGKHVLCEKPTALNAEQARRMLDAANAHPNQFALIDHELRFLPSLVRMRELVAQGAIGTVNYVFGTIMGSSRSDAKRAWNWWSDEASGGGLLGAVGSHQMDIVRFALNAEVTSVSANLHVFVSPRPDGEQMRPVTADDYYSLCLTYSNGALVTLEAAVTLRVDEPNAVTLHGTDGSLRWQDGELLHAEPGSAFKNITPADTVDVPASLNGAFPKGTVYIGHAIRAYLEGNPSALDAGATFTDGLRIQMALDAARQSNAQNNVRIAL